MTNKVFMIPEIAEKISVLIGEYENEKWLKLVTDEELLKYFDITYPVVLDVLEGNENYCLIRTKKQHIVNDSIKVENISVTFIPKAEVRRQIVNYMIELQKRQNSLLMIMQRI